MYKRIFLFSALLICSIYFTSCESNDATVFPTQTPVQVIPNNKVLIELFTNTSCIPCYPANVHLDNIHTLQGVTANDTNVIILRTHTTLFAGDPFYLYNETDNSARMNYYGASLANPLGFLDGKPMGGFNTAGWNTKINNRLAVLKNYGIVLSNNYNSSARTGSIDITLQQISGSQVSDMVVHVALVENDIPYNAPNSETHFNNTLRNLISTPSGDPVTLSSGSNVNLNYNYSVDNIIDHTKAEIIVFIQSVSTKDVYAAQIVKLF